MASDWLYHVPWGLRRILNWIKDHYGNPPVYITENGTSDDSGILNDQHRIDYYREYINQVLKGSIILWDNSRYGVRDELSLLSLSHPLSRPLSLSLKLSLEECASIGSVSYCPWVTSKQMPPCNVIAHYRHFSCMHVDNFHICHAYLYL